jgi:ribonuclease P protein component
VLVWRPKADEKCWRVVGPKGVNDWPQPLVERNKLPRSLSLKSQVEIDLLFKRGKRLSGDCFTLFWDSGETFRYGVFVSRKHGNAVERIRLKRLCREAIRLNRGLLKKQVKVVVVPRPAGKKPIFESINAEISRLFKQIENGQ